MNYLLPALIVVGALAVALVPLLRREPARLAYGEGELDAQLARYRQADAAGTVCDRCVEASPPGSRFCMRCGRRLPGRAAGAA